MHPLAAICAQHGEFNGGNEMRPSRMPSASPLCHTAEVAWDLGLPAAKLGAGTTGRNSTDCTTPTGEFSFYFRPLNFSNGKLHSLRTVAHLVDTVTVSTNRAQSECSEPSALDTRAFRELGQQGRKPSTRALTSITMPLATEDIPAQRRSTLEHSSGSTTTTPLRVG